MLRGIAGTSTLPWAVIGDFNEVIHGHEHDGVGNRSQAQMDAFWDALDTWGFTDIGYTGNSGRFERRVSGGTFTRVRLDRCVASSEWVLSYPNASLEHKDSASSDHSALLLKLDVHACMHEEQASLAVLFICDIDTLCCLQVSIHLCCSCMQILTFLLPA